MPESIPCFWLESTGESQEVAHWYSRSHKCGDPEKDGREKCCGTKLLQVVKMTDGMPDPSKATPFSSLLEMLAADESVTCPRCGWRPTKWEPDGDIYLSMSYLPLYQRTDTTELFTWGDAPAGALRHAAELEDERYYGEDGIALVCKTPGGGWYVDGPASNCTRRGQRHKCWCRHGDPKDPRGPSPLTVDKNCDTCQAGAGSIRAGEYHGWLQNGFLVSG